MKRFLKTFAFTLVLISASASVNAQPMDPNAPPPPPPPMQGGPGQMMSDHDLMHHRRQLEHIIQDLGQDQHDYGGFKEKAMQDLNAARQDLMQAEEFAHAHRN